MENRDSGVADVEVCPCIQSPVNNNPPEPKPVVGLAHSTQLKRSALSNSLLDIHDQCEYLQSSLNNFIRGIVDVQNVAD